MRAPSLRDLTPARADQWRRTYDRARGAHYDHGEAMRLAWGAARDGQRIDARNALNKLKAAGVFPHAMEREYRGRLLRRVRAVAHVVSDALHQWLRPVRADALPGERLNVGSSGLPSPQAIPASALDRILAALESVRRRVEVGMAPDLGTLETTGQHTAKYVARKVDDHLAGALPTPRAIPAIEIQDRAMLRQWARRNADLITSIDARYFGEVSRLIAEAVRTGRPTAEVAAELRMRTGVAEGRARTIARTEIARLNADVTRQRHADYGVKRYVWSTSLDERVRPTHARLEGTTQDWSAPPVSEADGSRHHPGSSWNCRCVSIALIEAEDIEAEVAK